MLQASMHCCYVHKVGFPAARHSLSAVHPRSHLQQGSQNTESKHACKLPAPHNPGMGACCTLCRVDTLKPHGRPAGTPGSTPSPGYTSIAGLGMCKSHSMSCEAQASACAAVTAQALHQVCAVCQSWRQIGKRVFFSQPWKSATLLCHPLQLFTTVRDLCTLASHDLSPAQEVNACLTLQGCMGATQTLYIWHLPHISTWNCGIDINVPQICIELDLAGSPAGKHARPYMGRLCTSN